MKPYLTFLLIAFLIALTLGTSCKGRRSGAGGGADSLAASTEITYPFTIDVSEEYPMEPISLQEVFGEMEYVALETTPDCLIPDLPGLQSPVVTDNDIFILSGHNPIFHFARDGKFIKRIGSQGRGPGEFLAATEMCVNERTEEIFVYDILSDVILLYGYDGKHKRTLRTARNTIIYDMAAITDSTLLIFNKSNDSSKDFAIPPFQIVSSRDGNLVRSLMPPYKEATAEISAERSSGNSDDQTKGYKPSISYIGQRIGDSDAWMASIKENNTIYVTAAGVEMTAFVADTVYVTSGAGALTPRWVKAPSPMGLDLARRRYSTLALESDRYAFFMAIGTDSGSGGNIAGYKVDKTTGGITQTYLYDANLDHERTRDNRIVSPRGVAKGRFAVPYQPFQLLQWLEEDKLSGELATLAATLKDTDNPVLLISKNPLTTE